MQNGDSAMPGADVRKLLVENRVRDIGHLTGKECVVLLDSATVEGALKVLSDYRILSAPVVAPGEGDGGGRSPAQHAAYWPAQLPGSDIMGFMCVNDVLMSFLDAYASEFGDAAFLEPVAGPEGGLVRRVSTAGGGGSMLGRMRRLEALGARFAQTALRDLTCKGCDGDFLHSRHAGEATLLELIMYGFLDPKRRGMHEGENQSRVVHRVALFDSSGTITSVISQSDLCRFLSQHVAELGPLALRTMSDLGWDCKPVVSCTPETPALDAMRAMVAAGVSSLAVVTPHAHHGDGHPAAGQPGQAAAGQAAGQAAPGGKGGRLLGNFSASEMRTMTAEHFGALSLPVGEFLALEHDTEWVAANRERMEEEGVLGSAAHAFIQDRLRRGRPHAPGEELGQRLIVATPGTSLAEVIHLLVRHRIHRVYVVDEHEIPRGIVTCTDILRAVVEAATQAAPPSPPNSATAVAAEAAAAGKNGSV
ncbi:hypothetical protein HYH03_016986 [Edaphochlamys debaryana]|uniref:CBS domain-containing protein n=1 Tax=Edaphochlamys debaryana TaxID=47281 RepID=A0A835XGG5_9CHLO|nr:hypothetical protein HYH03_016986 [Edaphochlamys debaryana]|eukprot:KAG2484172.1 hypothetical protein HYH03_016986 [Edaphochlamys debaryana]